MGNLLTCNREPSHPRLHRGFAPVDAPLRNNITSAATTIAPRPMATALSSAPAPALPAVGAAVPLVPMNVQSAEPVDDDQDELHVCVVCHRPTVMRCSQCGGIYYCSTRCELKDRPSHQANCAAPEKTIPQKAREMAEKAKDCTLTFIDKFRSFEWDKKIVVLEKEKMLSAYGSFKGRFEFYLYNPSFRHHFIFFRAARGGCPTIRTHLVLLPRRRTSLDMGNGEGTEQDQSRAWACEVKALDTWAPGEAKVQLSQHEWTLPQVAKTCAQYCHSFGRYSYWRHNCQAFIANMVPFLRSCGPDSAVERRHATALVNHEPDIIPYMVWGVCVWAVQQVHGKILLTE